MLNLLVLYEMAEKASKVKTKRAFKEFERWLTKILQTYHDAAIERAAHIYLFRLKSELSMA